MAALALIKGEVLEAGIFSRRPEARLEQPPEAKAAGAVQWMSPEGVVWVNPPVLTIGQRTIPAAIQSQSVSRRHATLRYQVGASEGEAPLDYTVDLTVSNAVGGALLLCRTVLHAQAPPKQDVRVAQTFEVRGRHATALIAEQCRANPGTRDEIRTEGMRAWRVSPGAPGAAYFEMGRGSTDRQGVIVSMPVAGLALGKGNGAGTPMLVLATDPYSGVQFQATNVAAGEVKSARISALSRYHGAKVPLRDETRTVALQFNADGADGMFRTFYATIPEIEPGAAWIHGVALNYYDYYSDSGKGWYRNIEKLAQIVPLEHRGKIPGGITLTAWISE